MMWIWCKDTYVSEFQILDELFSRYVSQIYEKFFILITSLDIMNCVSVLCDIV
jgi:hypothetical protein